MVRRDCRRNGIPGTDSSTHARRLQRLMLHPSGGWRAELSPGRAVFGWPLIVPMQPRDSANPRESPGDSLESASHCGEQGTGLVEPETEPCRRHRERIPHRGTRFVHPWQRPHRCVPTTATRDHRAASARASPAPASCLRLAPRCFRPPASVRNKSRRRRQFPPACRE